VVLKPLHLTTLAEAPHRRAELAREVFGRQILRLDVDPIPNMELQVDLKLWSLPGLKLLMGYSSGVTTPRTRSLLSDGDDDLFISLSRGGRLIAEQRGHQVMLEGGSIHMASNAEPMSFVHLNTRSMALLAPRKAIAALVPGVEDRIGMGLSPPPQVIRLLQGYIAAVAGRPVLPDGPLVDVLAPQFYDLVALALGIGRDARELVAGRGLKAARLNAIKTYVGKRLAGDLSVNVVAAAHQITPRYVQRLFEAEGTTFPAYVLDQRLAAARRLLADRILPRRSISAIAYECGFRDISHFNHMFRRRYGATPSDVRTLA
jgi:AraC-like DNA-binding protein